jgi:hypothetical protein
MGDQTRHKFEMQAIMEKEDEKPSSPIFSKERTKLSFDGGLVDSLPSTTSFRNDPTPTKTEDRRNNNNTIPRNRTLPKSGESFFDRPPPGPPPADQEEMGIPRMRSVIPTLPSGKIMRGFEGEEESRGLMTRGKIEKTKSMVDEGHASLAGRGMKKLSTNNFGIASEPSFVDKPKTKPATFISSKERNKLPSLEKVSSMGKRFDIDDGISSMIRDDPRFVESKPDEQIQGSVPAKEVTEHFEEMKRVVADDEVPDVYEAPGFFVSKTLINEDKTILVPDRVKSRERKDEEEIRRTSYDTEGSLLSPSPTRMSRNYILSAALPDPEPVPRRPAHREQQSREYRVQEDDHEISLKDVLSKQLLSLESHMSNIIHATCLVQNHELAAELESKLSEYRNALRCAREDERFDDCARLQQTIQDLAQNLESQKSTLKNLYEERDVFERRKMPTPTSARCMRDILKSIASPSKHTTSTRNETSRQQQRRQYNTNSSFTTQLVSVRDRLSDRMRNALDTEDYEQCENLKNRISEISGFEQSVAHLESQLADALDRQDYQQCATLKREIDRIRGEIVAFSESRRRSEMMVQNDAPTTMMETPAREYQRQRAIEETPPVIQQQLSPSAKSRIQRLETELFEAQIQEDFDRCVMLSGEINRILNRSTPSSSARLLARIGIDVSSPSLLSRRI